MTVRVAASAREARAATGSRRPVAARRLLLVLLVAAFALGFMSHTASGLADPSADGPSLPPASPTPGGWDAPAWGLPVLLASGVAVMVGLRWRR